MKALPKKLLPLTLFGIAVTSLLSVQLAQAYMVTLEQVGFDVVATGSGAINLTGLAFDGSAIGAIARVEASEGAIAMVVGGEQTDFYTGFTGPTNFGSGGLFEPNTNSGDVAVMEGGSGFIGVPAGYVSNTALSNSMTFNNTTFASLGVIPGTYEWTWGTGLPNQNFTLIIGPATVPDGGSTVSLLGCALLGVAALRRKLGC